MDGYAELVDEKVFGNFGAVENAESDDSADSGDEIPDFDLLKQAVDPEGQAEEEAAKKRQQKKIDEREGKYGQLKLSEKTLNEHLQECNRLMKVEDPIDKLFHSKYKAREILETLHDHYAKKAKACKENGEEEESAAHQLTMARLEVYIGVNYIESEETGHGERKLYIAVKKLQKDPFRYAPTLIKGWNQLGIVWSNRSKNRKARKYLLRSSNMYKQCMRMHTEIAPASPTPPESASSASSASPASPALSSSLSAPSTCPAKKDSTTDDITAHMTNVSLSVDADAKVQLTKDPSPTPAPPSATSPGGKAKLTSTEEQIRREAETPKTKTLVASISEYGWRMIEAEFTMTLYYLAQVCTRLQRSSDAAFYCQQTLSRQYARGEYDPVEWSKNAIVLSYFYMGELMFKQAHYCLSAAQCIMNKFPDRFHPVIENTVDKDDPDTPEEVIVADLARSWGTFYLNMLLTSRNNYLSKLQALQTRSGLAEMKEEKKESIYENISTDTTMSLFEDLELPEETPECNLAMLFSEARDLFKQGFNWFNIAKMFYILDGYVSDHIRILQNVSQLYKYLSDFETDLARICKMHKRRINMLEPLIDDISPKAYLEFYQQCADEVAKSYAEMMELKYAINKHRPAHMAKERAKAQQKINELALKAVQNYQIWLNSFSKDGLPPKTLEKDYQRHFLLAMFTVARLFGKIFHTNPQTYIVVLKKSLAQYESVVETVDRFEAMDVFKDEYAICKEMIHLLPLKMSKIMRTGLCFME